MNIPGSFGEIDKMGFAKLYKSSVDSVEKVVRREIACTLHPLSFKHFLKSFANIEMRGIRWQEEWSGIEVFDILQLYPLFLGKFYLCASHSSFLPHETAKIAPIYVN